MSPSRLPASNPVASLASPPLGLGLDGGGTQTRWALADHNGVIQEEGQIAPLPPAVLSREGGKRVWCEALQVLCHQLHARGGGWPLALHAGLSGYGGQDAEIVPLLAEGLGLAPSAITLSNDVEMAYRDAFDEQPGYLVYAGTGSIALHIDRQGQRHRAGGHGSVLDDAGGGHWIGREALRHIWRTEDESPGAWQHSPMAQALMHRLGGPDWAHTRAFLAQADRGAMGLLATTVAQTADCDPAAMAILQAAGRELGRLGRILLQRMGPQPVALAGRVWSLHPVIEQACRSALPAGLAVKRHDGQAHHAAARLAVSKLT